MKKLDWCEIQGNPTDEERVVLVAILEQTLAEESLPESPLSSWVRGELPGLPANPPGSHSGFWRRPATRKVAAAIGAGMGGVAASVAIAIKMRHHQHTSGSPDRRPTQNPAPREWRPFESRSSADQRPSTDSSSSG